MQNLIIFFFFLSILLFNNCQSSISKNEKTNNNKLRVLDEKYGFKGYKLDSNIKSVNLKDFKLLQPTSAVLDLDTKGELFEKNVKSKYDGRVKIYREIPEKESNDSRIGDAIVKSLILTFVENKLIKIDVDVDRSIEDVFLELYGEPSHKYSNNTLSYEISKMTWQTEKTRLNYKFTKTYYYKDNNYQGPRLSSAECNFIVEKIDANHILETIQKEIEVNSNNIKVKDRKNDL